MRLDLPCVSSLPRRGNSNTLPEIKLIPPNNDNSSSSSSILSEVKEEVHEDKGMSSESNPARH